MPLPAPPKEQPCGLYDCVCCWHRICSSRIPRVAPGKDYVCIPAGADDRPAWSVVVGFVGDSGLALHRFRVAPSGRVLGRSEDVLEVVHNVDDADAADGEEDQEDNNKSSVLTIGAEADLSPDGRSLLVICQQQRSSATSYEIVQPPRTLQLQLDLLNLNAADQTVSSPLPRLPLKRPMVCRLISAVGRIWAAYVHMPLCSMTSYCLVMLRLDDKNSTGSDQWVQAGAIDVQHEPEICPNRGGSIFQGHAVVGHTILVSLRPWTLFFSFDCSTCIWTAVTKKPRAVAVNKMPGGWYIPIENSEWYIPIEGQGMYIEEDKTIYFQSNSGIFAYGAPDYETQELVANPPSDDVEPVLVVKQPSNDVKLLVVKPPKMVDALWPYDEGSGLLTHLGGGLMCSVWISIDHYCSCNYFHVIISTVRLIKRRFANEVIQILHSTCRRLDKLPSNVHRGFCFLQGYEDEYNNENAMSSSMQLLMGIEDPTSSSYAVESSKMLDCCREYLFLFKPLQKGYYLLEEPLVQINKALYIVCEDGSRSTLYRTIIENGRLKTCHVDNPLEACQTITTSCEVICQPSPWHFICSGSNIYAVSLDLIYEFNLTRNSCNLLNPSRSTSFSLAMALQVGDKIIAVDHNLNVFCYVSSTSCWESYWTNNSCSTTARISGYVVLSADTFIVFYDEPSTYFLFDMQVRSWSDFFDSTSLFHEEELPSGSPTTISSRFHGEELPSSSYGSHLLHGRCVYVEGFIYSCTSGGLVAYGICDDGFHVHLFDPIFLNFSLPKNWKGEVMCLEYVGKDIVSGAIAFCVVQGDAYRCSRAQDVCITVVQVKTKRTLSDKMMPVSIEHVDIATCFVPCGQEFIGTSSCFAVGS